ncbi:MAG: hypothetical protein Q7U52_02525 [Hydrogenophaga sp.]|uniref:hypothetical protein n=1 Tax=Hydrogenophaga sp. TaxID=1904254 RepID=UPI0027270E6C|nr:hypothetical protein [Hydrogenophaga sp.]MDO9146544.1 hypothetical protein [Hydrogenophaga sp.]MDO9603583.1 hypothetical protein [Hydrogenophaga sp.]
MQANTIRRLSISTLLASLTGAAQAHGGHGPHELWDMLTHAIGLEQGLVLLGTGGVVWAVRQWRARRGQTVSK